MNNINQPASSYLAAVTSNARYRILTRSDYSATISDSDLSVGDLVTLDSGLQATVVAPNTLAIPFRDRSPFAYVASAEPKYAEVYSELVGYMRLACRVPSPHTAGLIGWSIYKGTILLAKGNDAKESTNLIIDTVIVEPRSWSLGSYLLQVTLFQRGLNPIRSRSIPFTVVQPLSELTSLSSTLNIIELN